MSAIEPSHVNEEMLALLTDCDLPVSDIAGSTAKFWVLRDGDKIRGCVGLETSNGVGLLRSLAVSTQYRGRGTGAALVDALEKAARADGVSDLYLITNTAQRFFEGLGYIPVARNDAPRFIAGSRQFTSLCPSSSVLMRKGALEQSEQS